MTSSTPQSDVLDVLIIGCGFSGIGAGIKLLQNGITNFRIFEKSHGIGGTWYDNTYPGAACDVPSHFYCYSFEPNPNWSRVYSPQPEIQRYLEACVDKFGLRSYISHGVRLTELRLDETARVWIARSADGDEARARHVINGGGGLHKPAYPQIAGRDKFAGASMHTARWDNTVDLRDKRIAIVGSAASAIQVIPEVAEKAAAVSVFQRTPNYIVPRGDRAYSDAEKRRFARWPWLLQLYRWLIYKRLDIVLFPITRKNSILGKRIAKKVIAHMRASVADPELQAQLKPTYLMGCKRILLSDDLFSALNRDNVSVITTGIRSIEPSGLRLSDNTVVEVDVVVYATGYDIDGHVRSIDVVGRDGKRLQDEWQNGPEAYFGCCVHGFPNYWMVTGPNTGVGTTSVVFMIEQMLGYLIKLIRHSRDGTLITVKCEAQRRYNDEIQAALADSVWLSGCNSWYLNENGKITTLYPYNAKTFCKQMSRIRYDDYEVSSVPDGTAV